MVAYFPDGMIQAIRLQNLVWLFTARGMNECMPCQFEHPSDIDWLYCY